MVLFRGFSGSFPSTGITIRAADKVLWQALNDTPTSTRSLAQPQRGCLPGTTHQFLHYMLINSCTISRVLGTAPAPDPSRTRRAGARSRPRTSRREPIHCRGSEYNARPIPRRVPPNACATTNCPGPGCGRSTACSAWCAATAPTPFRQPVLDGGEDRILVSNNALLQRSSATQRTLVSDIGEPSRSTGRVRPRPRGWAA